MREHIEAEIERFVARMAEFGVNALILHWSIREADGNWTMERYGMGSPWAQEGMMREDLREIERSEVKFSDDFPPPDEPEEGEEWKAGA